MPSRTVSNAPVNRSRCAKFDLFEFDNLAADMGLNGVEPTSYYFPPNVSPDYLNFRSADLIATP